MIITFFTGIDAPVAAESEGTDAGAIPLTASLAGEADPVGDIALLARTALSITTERRRMLAGAGVKITGAAIAASWER